MSLLSIMSLVVLVVNMVPAVHATASAACNTYSTKTTCEANGCVWKIATGDAEIDHCEEGVAVCFPESATLRRLSKPNAWEVVTVSKLRIGDTVECLVRSPFFQDDGSVKSAAYGQLSGCQVYDYKKANVATTAAYTSLTYQLPGSSTENVVSMSPNHHVLSAETGQAVEAGMIKAGDSLLMVLGGTTRIVKVVKSAAVSADGAYAPLLTQGGLPVVNNIVAYPSSGVSDVGLDAKHWGQYYLTAPVWQTYSNDAPGESLYELGSKKGQEIGAFTQKFYAVGAAAAKEGRVVGDWAGVAREMYHAIAKGKMYSEAEALDVYDRHLMKPAV